MVCIALQEDRLATQLRLELEMSFFDEVSAETAGKNGRFHMVGALSRCDVIKVSRLNDSFNRAIGDFNHTVTTRKRA